MGSDEPSDLAKKLGNLYGRVVIKFMLYLKSIIERIYEKLDSKV